MRVESMLLYVSFGINILNFSERFGLLEVTKKMTIRTWVDIVILLSLLITGFIYIRMRVIESKAKRQYRIDEINTDLLGRINQLWENITGHYSNHNAAVENLKTLMLQKINSIEAELMSLKDKIGK